jgi:hypothetical protein
MNQVVAMYPLSSVLAQAAATQALLAGCKVKLVKSPFNPAFQTTLADVLAQEADYSGYPSGGFTLAAFQNPLLAPGQGAAIIGATVQFARDGTSPGVNNVIGGWALVTSGDVLWAVGTFPQDIPFQVPGQGTPIILNFGFPSG